MKFYSSVLLFLLIYLFGFREGNGAIYTCPDYQLYFQKILGYRPYVTTFTNGPMYRDTKSVMGTEPSAINIKCWELCKNDHECSGYILFFNSSECYGITRNDRSTRYYPLKNSILIQDQNSAYFEKLCFHYVPINCKRNLWVITKIPASNLIFQGKKTLPYLVDRTNCTEHCLNEAEFSCLSASFMVSHRNNQIRMGRNNLRYDESLGTCILSSKDKSMQPDAFRVSNDDEEYIENQCIERAWENDKCSYEIYANSMLIYADIEYRGLTQKQCKEKCTYQSRFYCQGVSYFDENLGLQFTKCFLHSEDIISLGPRFLVPQKNFLYMKRVKCLNVTVTCTRNTMMVKYTPYNWFSGTMYVNSHSNECYVSGNGTRPTTLQLAIGNENQEKQCGIIRAYERNNTLIYTTSNSRTLLSTLIVIQNNPIVQTQGDRLIKIGCILNNNINGSVNDIILGSSIEFSNSSPLNSGSQLINSSSTSTVTNDFDYPDVRLQIVNLDERVQTTDVNLGQNLELQILMEPPTNKEYDIQAVQLIAKSDDGHNSILLIDNRGCPTDLTVFPQLQKIVNNQIHMLYGKFHAFKFAGSAYVNFDVMIHFCLRQCKPISCPNNVFSYGRRKKRTIDDDDEQELYRQDNNAYDEKPTFGDFNDVVNSTNFQQILTNNLPDMFNNNEYNENNPNNNIENYIESAGQNVGIAPELETLRIQENNVIHQRIITKINDEEEIVSQTIGNFTITSQNQNNIDINNNNNLLKQLKITNVPLNIKLNVRDPPNVLDTNSLIYGENNHILVASAETDYQVAENTVCINQTLMVLLLLLWILLQVILIATCCILIRKYKRIARQNEIDGDDNSSLKRIQDENSLDYIRRVHWADQNRSSVLIFA